MKTSKCTDLVKSVLYVSGLTAAVIGGTGCQGSYSGQTLPSPYYIHDDVQYFPPGPEFKLSREAAAMKAFNAQQQLQGLP